MSIGSAIIKGLNKADDIITGGLAERASKYALSGKGESKLFAKIASNTSATNADTVMGRAVEAAKESKLGKRLVPEKGFALNGTAQLSDDAYNGIKESVMKRAADAGLTEEQTAKVVERLDSLKGADLNTRKNFGDLVSEYYGDAANGKVRKIATGVGVGGAMLGTRLLTGGDLTHNGSGERDIIGIPFI